MVYWITGLMSLRNKSTRLGGGAYSPEADQVEIYEY